MECRKRFEDHMQEVHGEDDFDRQEEDGDPTVYTNPRVQRKWSDWCEAYSWGYTAGQPIPATAE